MNGETLRALGRAKKEAEAPPIIFTEDRRERVRFFVWVVAGFISLIVTIVTATGVVIKYRSDLTQCVTDLALLRADLAAVRADAVLAREKASRNEEELIRRKEPLDTVVKKMALLDTYDFRKLTEQVADLISLREYGISNKEWYLGKHGYPPPTNPAAQPR